MASVKASTLEGAAVAAESRVHMRCGDCMHFQQSSHPQFGQVCEQRGVKKFATAPNCYTANVHVFRRVSPKTFLTLAPIVAGFSNQQARVFMGLLNTQAQLEKLGLFLLQRVFFCIGNDYLDNYYSAYVLGVGPEKHILLVGSDYLKTQKGATVAQLMKDSLLDHKEFVKRRAYLIEHGLLYEPRKPHKNELEGAAEYEPPTMETPVSLLEKNANRSTNPKKNKKRNSTSRVQSEETVLEVDLSSEE